MSLEGTIVNGRVELDEPGDLPEGARVRIELLATESAPAREPAASDRPLSPLAERLLALAGQARGLPPDMARNHGHHIHGARKR